MLYFYSNDSSELNLWGIFSECFYGGFIITSKFSLCLSLLLLKIKILRGGVRLGWGLRVKDV